MYFIWKNRCNLKDDSDTILGALDGGGGVLMSHADF